MKKIIITTEPDFKKEPVEWVAWNMKKYNNNLTTALILLNQRKALEHF
jgi:hypothetical protein